MWLLLTTFRLDVNELIPGTPVTASCKRAVWYRCGAVRRGMAWHGMQVSEHQGGEGGVCAFFSCNNNNNNNNVNRPRMRCSASCLLARGTCAAGRYVGM